MFPVGAISLEPGEAERRFEADWEVQRIAGGTDLPGWGRAWAEYLMTRRARHG